MQLSIAPKFRAREQALMQPTLQPELSSSSNEEKNKPSPLYAVAVVVRIGILGTVLLHAFTFWPW